MNKWFLLLIPVIGLLAWKLWSRKATAVTPIKTTALTPQSVGIDDNLVAARESVGIDNDLVAARGGGVASVASVYKAESDRRGVTSLTSIYKVAPTHTVKPKIPPRPLFTRLPLLSQEEIIAKATLDLSIAEAGLTDPNRIVDAYTKRDDLMVKQAVAFRNARGRVYGLDADDSRYGVDPASNSKEVAKATAELALMERQMSYDLGMEDLRARYGNALYNTEAGKAAQAELDSRSLPNIEALENFVKSGLTLMEAYTLAGGQASNEQNTTFWNTQGFTKAFAEAIPPAVPAISPAEVPDWE